MIQKLKAIGKHFRAKDDGAVTVDWVVLVSAVIGICILVVAIILQGATDYSMRLNSEVEKIDVMIYD